MSRRPAVAGFAGLTLSVALAVSLVGARPARAADELLFCNSPERLRMGGSHADRLLKAGRTYRIFFHYRNDTKGIGPLVVSFQGINGKPVSVMARKGIADPHPDPPHAGRQAMARFLKAPERRYGGKEKVRFPIPLKPWQVGSGVLRVQVKGHDTRLRIYFRHDRYTVPGAQVVAIPSPRRDYDVVLSAQSRDRYFRIGVPEPELRKLMDGAYGLIYSFKVSAPAGSKVRIAFSPRGGQAGLVGTVDGILRQSRIVGATVWSVFTEAVVGKNGMVLTTLPFGGVFYPVEVAFRLL
jgi:hypothetical protein